MLLLTIRAITGRAVHLALVPRNDKELYIDSANPGGATAPDIALTQDSVRALVNGSIFCPVSGLKAAPAIIEFSVDDPFDFKPIPIPIPNLSSMSHDGSIVIGDNASFLGKQIQLWEENSDAWGITEHNGTNSALLADLLGFYLSAEQQAQIDFPNWLFASQSLHENPTRDIQVYKNACVKKSALVAYGTNADGQREAFLVSVVSRELLPGDVNLDCVVNLLDVAGFIDLISSGTFQPEADINDDGVVNLLDVGPFIELLSR